MRRRSAINTITPTESNQMKNETKHTAGPWMVLNATQSPHYVYVGRHTGNEVLAQIVTSIERQRSGEDKANATLLAAAPELLEMVEALSKAYRDRRFYPDLLSDAVAIIAKAKGTP
jgi:hypothetical protein